MISLTALMALMIPVAILVLTDENTFGSFVKRLFGGTALCVASCLLATTVAWVIVGEPGTRRRNGGVIGVMVGLGAGFGIVAALVFTRWTLGNADDKLLAIIVAIPATTLLGFLVGFLIARGAPPAPPRGRRGYLPSGPRYSP